MTARSAGQTFFTLRRVIACGIPLLLALAVLLALCWPQGGSVHDLKVEFVRFETSDDGGFTDYAVLIVRNDSSREWVLVGAKEWLPVKEEMFLARGRLTTKRGTGESGHAARHYIGGGVVHTLKTNSLDQVAVPLPRTDEKGWIEIFCWTPPKIRRGLPGLVQQLWWRARPPKALWTWLRCDVPIQCGREDSHGKPVPPHVLSEDRSGLP